MELYVPAQSNGLLFDRVQGCLERGLVFTGAYFFNSSNTKCVVHWMIRINDIIRLNLIASTVNNVRPII